MDIQAMQGIIRTAIGGVALIVAMGFLGILLMVIFAIRYGMRLTQVRELERALRIADAEGRIRYRNKCEAAMDEKRQRLQQQAEAAQVDLADVEPGPAALG